jgi:hypothetical protein
VFQGKNKYCKPIFILQKQNRSGGVAQGVSPEFKLHTTKKKKKSKNKWAPVGHACNPNYSGERDQEDHG